MKEGRPEKNYFPDSLPEQPPGLRGVLAKAFDRLRDGRSYTGDSIREAMGNDQYSGKASLRFNLWRLRKILRPMGLDVVCDTIPGRKARKTYRMVILLTELEYAEDEDPCWDRVDSL